MAQNPLTIKFSEKYQTFLSLLFIFIVGFIAYSNSFYCGFHFDDLVYIIRNHDIRQITDISVNWNKMSHQTRWVTFYSFALNYYFHKLDVFGYHVVNFFIHCINAWMVFLFIRMLGQTPYYLKKMREGVPLTAIALLSALIFITHPVQTQAVTYITQRFASLATMFYLISITCYLKARLTNNHRGFLGGALLAAIFGLMTKEIVFTLPFMFIVVELLFFFHEINFLSFIKKIKIIYWICLSLFLITIPALFSFQLKPIFFPDFASQSHWGDTINLTRYFLTQLRVLWTYVRLLFLPVKLNLDYDYTLSYSLLEGNTMIAFLAWLVAFWGMIRVFRWDRLAGFGLICFFLTISVESSFIPIRHVIFEHRLYLPMLGFAVFFSRVLWLHLNKNKFLWRVVCGAIIGIFVLLTFLRNFDYKDEITLWTDVIKKSPLKPRGYYNLGIEYVNNGKYDRAIALFNKAIELQPAYYQVYNNRGYVYMKQGLDNLAMKDFNQSIAISAINPEALTNRGAFYLKHTQYEKAKADITEALNQDDTYIEALNNRSVLYFHEGNNERALAFVNRALAYDSGYAEGYYNRGTIFIKLNNYKEAIANFTKCLQLNPDHLKALNNRGIMYFRKKDFHKALSDFNRAIALNPNFLESLTNRGELLGMIKKYEEAFEDFSRALKVDPNYELAWVGAGRINLINKNNDMALQEFNRAIEINPNRAATYYYRSFIYSALGDKVNFNADRLKAKQLGYKFNDSSSP